MKKSLAKIFNETATAAYEAFPSELNNLVILTTSSRAPVYVSPEIADQLTENTAAVKKAIAKETNYLLARASAGVAYNPYNLAGTSVKMIALVKNQRGIFSPRYTKKMWSIFVLDHEIGHHILPNGHYRVSGNPQHSESVCDAYALLRHIQRSGKNTDTVEMRGNHNAARLILLSDTNHYTTDAMQRTKEVAEEMDISSLSPHETVELAEKIAFECRLDPVTLEKIRDAFQPVYASCRKNIGDGNAIIDKIFQEDKDAYTLFCRETLSVMKKYRNDADIFEVGKRFLSYPPVKKFMQAGAETDPYWKNAISFMEKPQKAALKKPVLAA